MNYGKAILAFLLMTISVPGYACILRNIVNNSDRCEMLFRSVIIPGMEKSGKPNVVTPRVGDKEHIVNTGKVGVGLGEYMRILVTEQTPLGSICKKYRLFVDEKHKHLQVQEKDSCIIGEGEYETLGYKPIPIDPQHCYVDVYLNDDVNSLYVNVVSDPNEELEPVEAVMAEQGAKPSIITPEDLGAPAISVLDGEAGAPQAGYGQVHLQGD